MRPTLPLLCGMLAATGCDRPRPVPSPTAVATPAPAPTAAAPAMTRTGPQDYAATATGPLTIEGTDTNYTIRLPTDTLFDFDKAALRPGATALLQQALDHLKGRRVLALQVFGHTDSKGDGAYNHRLSLRRAQAVCAWLKQAGSPYTLCLGRGEDEPVAPNANPDGSDNAVNRQRNRRVDLRVALAPDVGAMLDQARGQAAGAR